MLNDITLGNRFLEAVAFAVEAHAGDVRKGTTIPYASHLLQVAGLVLEFGGTETEAIGALLHDTAEDAGGEKILDEIKSKFGEEVEKIVRENSDSITALKSEKAPWRVRKESYVAAIAHKSESGCLVSICDKIHNARSLNTDNRNIGDSHWERFNASKQDSLWYYNALLEAFRSRLKGVDRFQPAISELEESVNQLKP